MQKLFQVQIAIPALILCASFHLPAIADTPLLPGIFSKSSSDLRPNQQKLVTVDREIMLELIKLARFNVHYRLECNRRWEWRNWLYPTAQEAGAAASYANKLIDLKQRT